jgi:hypothetical protein
VFKACYQNVSETSEDARFDRIYKKRNKDDKEEEDIIILNIFCYSCRNKSIPRSLVALSKFNYALLLKQFGFAIRLGIEQRDVAIKMGGVGSTTLLFKDDIFVMPGAEYHSMVKEAPVSELLIEIFKPQNEYYTL